MKQSILYALFSALITAAFLAGTPASAETPADTHVSLVQTADLDLRTASGQRRLEQRLAHAVREVCGAASDADLEGKKEVRKCRAEAIARASAQRSRIVEVAVRRPAIAVTAER